MAECSRSDMELQGHCLGNTCLGRDDHTAVLASTGTWKCGTPQQYSQEMATPGGGRRWLTSWGWMLAHPQLMAWDFEFHHPV